MALAQANSILAQCRAAFPGLRFELKIIKTSGDKLQTASLAQPGKSLPKGLFTKELEIALLKQRADLAVHSLKDLPTELPTGLKLGAVGKRADVRDVVIFRDAEFLKQIAETPNPAERASGHSKGRGLKPNATLADFPRGATVATSSPRRKAQLLVHRPDFNVVEIRGNVPTRLQKLADQPELDAVILAAAGLGRLGYTFGVNGQLAGDAIPTGLLAMRLEPELMLPAPGQGAVGIEIRENDERIDRICERLNHPNTQQCVLAERAFLHAMGGGCQSPVAAYGEVVREQIRLRAVSFQSGPARQGEARRPVGEAVQLGEELAAQLKK